MKKTLTALLLFVSSLVAMDPENFKPFVKKYPHFFGLENATEQQITNATYGNFYESCLVHFPDSLTQPNMKETAIEPAHFYFLRLMELFGGKYIIGDAYRSFELQKELFRKSKRKYEDKRVNFMQANPYLTVSDHQQGIGIDICFADGTYIDAKAKKEIQEAIDTHRFPITFPYHWEAWHARLDFKRFNEETYLKEKHGIEEYYLQAGLAYPNCSQSTSISH